MAAWDVTTAAASKLFDTDVGIYSEPVQVDANHFINFWRSESSDGYTQVFEVNTSTWAVTTVSARLEYDTQLSQDISAVQVDTNHFLAIWRGGAGITGKAQVFTVNTSTWAVTTAAAAFTFDTRFSQYTSLCKIDTNHFFQAWNGGAATTDAWVGMLTVNTTTWAVTTSAAKFQFDTDLGTYFECVTIDTNHVLTIWQGLDGDGYAQVFTVNTTTWAITTAAAQFEFDTQSSLYHSCLQIDSNHFILFRAGASQDGFVEVLAVNTSTWAVSTVAAPLEFDTQNSLYNSCEKVDTNHFILFYAGEATTSDGFVQVFEVNTTTWAVTTVGTKLEFDTNDIGYNGSVAIDATHFLNFWRGGAATQDGWCQVFTVELPGAGTDYDEAYSEVITVVDVVSKQGGKGLTDIVTVVDVLSKQGGKVLSDIVTVVDIVSKQGGKVLAEVFTVVDTVYAAITARVFTEVITVVDTVKRDVSRAFVEVVTVVDTVVKEVGKFFSDVVTLVDSINVTKVAPITLTEIVTLVDTVAVKITAKSLDEIITVVDTMSRSFSRFLNETVTVVDVLSNQAGKYLNDAVTVVDAIATSIGYSRAFTEIVTVVDTVSKQTGKFLSEVVTVVDDLIASVLAPILISLSETLTVVDTLTRQTGKYFNEAVEVVDTVLKATGRLFAEVFTVIDTFTRITEFHKALTEAFTVVDTVTTKITAKALTETIEIVDTIARTISRAFVEVITVIDLMALYKWARGFILGLNKDTNTGIGARSTMFLGRNRDTNTGIGERRNPQVGKNKDTNTGIGTRLK